MYRYYSINRPVSIGTFPRTKEVVSIKNYGARIEVDGLIAWGHIDYAEPLDERDASAYELVDARKKTWYGVMAKVVDGLVEKAKVTRKYSIVKPTDTERDVNGFGSLLVTYWCDSEEEAVELCESVA